MKYSVLTLSLMTIASCVAVLPGSSAAPARYDWQNVAIGGGGYVTGVFSHPSGKATFLRTDVGGFYRREGDAWQPLSDGFESAQSNYFGGEGLAFDPQNSATIFIAAGKYTADWAGKGALFRSADNGRTWKKLALELPMGGNEDRRWGGERLAVDPFDGNHILFGSRAGELHQSRNAGVSWARVASPQSGKSGIGIVSVAFDSHRRGQVFLNTPGAGIAHSSDGGHSWRELEGAPQNALRLAPLADGLLVTAEGDSQNTARGGVWKWNGAKWSDITPPISAENAKNGFCALTVHPRDEKTVVVATSQLQASFFLSKDGGRSWKTLKNEPQNSVPWQKTTLGERSFAAHVASLTFDGTSDQVLFCDWYGVWKSAPLGDGSATIGWTNQARGLEEIVAFSLLSPPQGAPLLSGLADVDGFSHQNFDAYPTAAYGTSGPWFQNTFDLAFCAQKPQLLARVGGNAWNNTYWGALSDNGGATWSEFGPRRGAPILRVAMDSGDPQSLVILNSEAPAQISRDGGKSWNQCRGLPNGPRGPWYWGRPLVADAVRSGVFYVAQNESFYRSENGGATFEKLGALAEGGHGILAARPKIAGELWRSAGDKGLFRSVDGGENWRKVAGIESAALLAVGNVKDVFSVFVLGRKDGQNGLFRSLDEGKNWQKIEAAKGFLPGNEPNCMTLSGQGDGALFVGTNGRGVFVGKPAP